MWGKIKAWFKNSATIVWARLQYIGGILIAGLVATFGDYDFKTLATMTARDAIHVVMSLAVAGVITELCRRRSLPPNPPSGGG